MDEQAPHESTISIIINKNDNNNPQEISKNIITKESSASSSVLTGLHAGYFRICLSLGSQVLLWSNLFHSHTLPSMLFLLLWWLSLCTLILLSALYLLRCIFYSRLVKTEFSHHVGVNFLFIPWISWLLLLQAIPSVHLNNFYGRNLLWVFIVPIVILDIKIYGQWITTEKRFLSMLANPTSQLSVIGNLVGAWAAARMGWKESGVSVFTLGLAHYLVVFVTLYQRLHGASRFPAMLRPDLFLFVAAPSMASLGWSSISGSFGLPCKMLYFLSLFLFASLICRPALFKKSMKRFNIAWWAYSFPLTFLALASAEYAQEVKGFVASTLMLILSALSVLVFLGIMVFTAINTDRLMRGK
ncbi:s-type anion channel slah1 [Phtheirospermum japonicum]|uniref:S-type anion channel slah1 n=1 Tax=Phtheirospermum japonicum TaxID=374723 RepID=A0A830BTR8_9LAMI|nr:s-type anion channel slah1 [Phtheirospermum japonicum]